MSTISSASTNRKSRRVPAELRQRTENSCDRCKTRKHKCRRVPGSEDDRCFHCAKYGYECTVTKPRKPRLPPAAAAAAAAGVLVDAYSARMEAMEELIKGLVPEADVSSLESLYRVGKELGISISSEGSHKPGNADLENGDNSIPSAFLNDTDKQPSQRSTRSLPQPPTMASYASPPPSSPATSSTSSNQSEGLVQDRQGQRQYIGQASSYYFQIHLQALVGGGQKSDAGQMQLFGPNPVDKTGLLFRQPVSPNVIEEESAVSLPPPRNDNRRLSSAKYTSVQPAAVAAVEAGIRLLSGPQASEVISCVHAFFEHVNADFHVLHEASFLETLEATIKKTQDKSASIDRVLLCTLYCVVILGRLHLTSPPPSSADSADTDEVWLWAQIEALLPTVLFTTSLASIQALLLASLHLHNTNSRDVCWTLTGAALRLAYAIGLHRPGLVDNDTVATAPPLLRSIRRTIWWTLYAFEQLQVSSHDRPSAVGSRHVQPLLTVGSSGYGHAEQASRLTMLLGRANAMPEAVRTNYCGPLAPAVALLRDLTRWHSALPAHLSIDAVQYAPPGIQRATLLLHIQYHYIVCLVSRHALLSRYTAMQKGSAKSGAGFQDSSENNESNEAMSLTLTSPCSPTAIADTCQNSGREAIVLLLRMSELRHFNARTGLDVYYLYSAALVLVLSLVCDTAQRKNAAATETRKLFRRCADLAAKHLRENQTPGTMRRWLGIIGDLHKGMSNTQFRTRNTDKTGNAKQTAKQHEHRPHPYTQDIILRSRLPAQLPPNITEIEASPSLINGLQVGPQDPIFTFDTPNSRVQQTSPTLASELVLDIATLADGRMDMSGFVSPPAIPPLVLEFFNTSNTNSTLDGTLGTVPEDWSFDYLMSTDDAQTISPW